MAVSFLGGETPPLLAEREFCVSLEFTHSTDMMNQPSLCEIWTSMDKGAPMLAAEKVQVRVEGGILGDRYETGNGAFSRWPGTGRALTLITMEDILWMRENHGLDLTKGEHRRNLVIQGVTLEELKGRTFQIGSLRVQAVRDCAPCAYLQTLLAVDVMKIMNGRGGLRLDVLTGGEISVGDIISWNPSERRVLP